MTQVRDDGRSVTTVRSARAVYVATAALLAVIVAAAALVLVARHHRLADARAYDPLEASDGGGSWLGPEGLDHLAGDTGALRLTGPTGTRQNFIMPLYNHGEADVRVLVALPDPLVTRVQWSEYVPVNGGSVFGTDQPWHDFPMTLRAGERVRLRLTLTKPDACTDRGIPMDFSQHWTPGTSLRWSGRGFTHTTSLTVDRDYLVDVCGTGS